MDSSYIDTKFILCRPFPLQVRNWVTSPKNHYETFRFRIVALDGLRGWNPYHGSLELTNAPSKSEIAVIVEGLENRCRERI